MIGCYLFDLQENAKYPPDSADSAFRWLVGTAGRGL